jgi:hypothetical protein
MDEIHVQVDEHFLMSIANALMPLIHGQYADQKFLDELLVMQRYSQSTTTSVAHVYKQQHVNDALSAAVTSGERQSGIGSSDSNRVKSSKWGVLRHEEKRLALDRRKLAAQLTYPLHMFEPQAKHHRGEAPADQVLQLLYVETLQICAVKLNLTFRTGSETGSECLDLSHLGTFGILGYTCVY